MKNTLIIVFMLLLVSYGCGKQTIDVEDSEHTASGDINIIIDWNLDQLKDAFIDSCTAEFDNQEDIDACVSEQVSDLVKLINEGIAQAEEEDEVN